MAKQGGAAAGADDAGGNDRSGADLGSDDANDVGLLDAFEEELEESDRESAEFGRSAKRTKAGDADDDGEEEGDGARDRKKSKAKDQDDDADDDGEDQDSDADDEDDEGEADKSKAKSKDGDDDADDEGEDPDGDYVVDDEGKEFAVSDLLGAYKIATEVKGQRDQILARIETDAKQKAETHIKAVEAKAKDMADVLELITALVPKLEDPATYLLDKDDERYDPDAYHFLARAKADVEAVVTKAKDALKAKKDTDDKAAETTRQGTLRKNVLALYKARPDFRDPDKAKKLTDRISSGLQKHYGYTVDEINAIEDPRYFDVILDAIAHRAAKAKGPPVVDTKDKRKPRLVRSSERETPVNGKRDRTSRSTRRGALDRLRRTGDVKGNDLEAVFGDFVD